jgi:hypothetical protein
MPDVWTIVIFGVRTVFFRGSICGTLIAVSLRALWYPLLREIFAMRQRAATVALPGEQR